MIQLQNITLQRGQKVLLEAANLVVHGGWKVGITGKNGIGKSSLFELLRGRLLPELGDVKMPAGWRIAHIAQETPETEDSALKYVLDGDRELRQLERELEAAQTRDDGTAIAEIHAKLDNIDAWSAPARAARLLSGLGFSDAQMQQPVSSFSGGWRMRLNLARTLLIPSDLLLLDEPTNHLDLDAVIWFEQWLKRYLGTLLMISHDRDFLDNVAEYTMLVENRQLTIANGNYSMFEQRRAEQLALQEVLYKKQQRERAHLQAFVDRFKAKATKAKQAQSRVKALEKMDVIAAVQVESPFRFEFSLAGRCPNPLTEMKHIDLGYGDHTVLHDLEFVINAGARIGLLGPNGAGKSTFIKLLAEELKPKQGEKRDAQNMVVGYFAQHCLEQLDLTSTPLKHLQKIATQASDQQLRDYLGGFGFRGDMALAPVAPFSGGEKARLALALVVWQKPNLLLLDEPTNHLDMQMREALVLALQSFDGAMVVVSHDRHLLRTTTDQLWLVADGNIRNFDGDLDDYRSWLIQQRAAAETSTTKQSATQKRESQEQRQQRKKAETRLKTLERQLDTLTAKKAEWDEVLADPDLYTDQAKADAAIAAQAKVRSELEAVEEEWMTLSELLEEA